MNAAGEVVGLSMPMLDQSSHAFLYAAGTMSDLEGFPAALDLTGINAGGKVVWYGTVSDGSYHGFLDANGTMSDLDALIDPTCGLTIDEARAVNDAGWIAATGTDAACAVHARPPPDADDCCCIAG